MMADVAGNGAISEAIAVTNGVKQGLVPVPNLFSPIFSAMLMEAYRYERPGIRFAYRTNGRLLNSTRMEALIRPSTATVHDLLFAVVCALSTTTEEDMQRSMNLFASGCAYFALTINGDETVAMH
ncbi:hypothetical protein SprV_0200851600 [Sparganum proliferum]